MKMISTRVDTTQVIHAQEVSTIWTILIDLVCFAHILPAINLMASLWISKYQEP